MFLDRLIEGTTVQILINTQDIRNQSKQQTKNTVIFNLTIVTGI